MLKKIIISSTFVLLSFSISSAETPSGYYAPASIAGGTLNAQDSNWPVYDETISFSNAGTFTASITNGIDDPSGSGSYTYSKTGTNTASLAYTIDGPTYSFEYDFQFTGENAGIYTKYADYGGGTTDVTTGPFSLSGVAVPEQYVWEDYDDFSSANVDASKWSTGHWDGGNIPTISASKIVFSGNTISGFKDVLPTAGMLGFNAGIKPLLEESFATSNGSQSHSYLELLNDEDISGIEVEVQLPADASTSTGVGLYASDWSKAFSEDQSEKSFFGLDLRSDHIDVEYVDPNTGSFVSSSISTELGRSHIFAFIFEDQNVLLFVDGAKVAEFSSASFSRDSILIRAMNGAGESFSAYAQNVRVIRNWEDYDDFSDNSLDTSKWTATSSYFVGNQPSEVNGRIELSGLTSQYSNTFLLFKNSEGINGVEADIWLPSNAPVDTGVLIGITDAGTPVGYLDLWAKIDQTKIYIHLGNSTTEEAIDFTRNAELGKIYKVAIIKGEQKTALYLDGEKVAEVNTWQSNNLDIIFRGVNDAGSSFTAYIDSVRVLRRSQAVPQINVKPGKMAGGRDSVYLQTPNGPELLEDAGEINFDLELVDQPTVTAATLKVDGQAYDLTQNEGPAVFRTRYGYGTGEVYELYDVESSSDSDWSSYANGKEFEFSLTVGGNEYAYLHELPGEVALPTPPNLSVTDADSWKVDQDGYDYLEVLSADNYLVTWDAFDTSDSRDFIQVSLVELIGEDEENIFEDIVLSASVTDYKIDGSLLEKDKYYLFYVEFLNVTQSENPNGFTHANASDSSEFILRSSATSVTALGFMLGNTEPVTVISDPNGQAVVVQVGEEYQWSSNLNGVTLWSVDQSGGDIQPITMRFENGRNFGNEGFYDSVALPQPYDMPFVIDENGYIKVTEDSGYQYYHVVSVEKGVIATLEGDEHGVVDDGVSVADQWFFTTRAAAEEYYYSKANPKNWMWFDHYPWVYSEEEGDWLYFYPSGGTLMYWSNKGQAWRQFN